MQRIYSLLVIILLSSFFSNSYSSVPHRINSRIVKGKCKSLVIKCFCNINKNDTKIIWERCYYDDYDSLTYDLKGNILSSSGFDFDWKAHNSIFEYDSLSNRVSSKSYDSQGKLLNHSRYSYQFDNKGHIIEVTLIETGAGIVNNYKTSTLNYKYDENGNQIERSVTNPKGIASKTVYKFNENNKVIEETHFTSAGKIWTRESYRYDSQGNRTDWDHYNPDTKLTSSIRQKYDHSNNLIDNEIYEISDGQLQFSFRTHLKYDGSNNQTEVNTYNEKGDLLSKMSYEYKYDNQGNWTECAELYKKEPVKKIIRKIEYY